MESKRKTMSEATPEPSPQPEAPKFISKIPVFGEDLAGEWPRVKTIRYTIALVAVAVAVVTAIVVFSYMQWHYSDRMTLDQQLQDYLKRQIDDLHRTEVAKPAPGPPATVTPPLRTATELADQSNSQLRENAEKFATQLRRYSAAYDVEERAIADREFAERAIIPLGDKEAMKKKWLQDMQIDNQRRNLHQADFDTRFRTSLLAYREEICKRLQFTSPCPQDTRSHLIDYGMLAGVSPIQELADYLEQISRLLPNDSR